MSEQGQSPRVVRPERKDAGLKRGAIMGPLKLLQASRASAFVCSLYISKGSRKQQKGSFEITGEPALPACPRGLHRSSNAYGFWVHLKDQQVFGHK